MRFFSFLLCLAAASVAIAQPAAPAKKSAFDKATFEAYIRHAEMLPDSLPVKISDPKPSIFPNLDEVYLTISAPDGDATVRYFVSKDGQQIVKGNVFDVNKNPFAAELGKLKTDLQPSFGEPGAPVVIVLFSDFECPNCKEEAAIVHQDIQKSFPKDVRVYFVDNPLEKKHPWSRQAAIAGRCVFRQNAPAFWDYYDWIYEHQSEILPDNLRSKVIGWADSKNLDSQKIGACMESNATAGDVDREIAEGHSLQVNGTPTMFINGRPVTGALPWAVLGEVIKREIDYQKTAANAGEKCCEISIPTLAPKK